MFIQVSEAPSQTPVEDNILSSPKQKNRRKKDFKFRKERKKTKVVEEETSSKPTLSPRVENKEKKAWTFDRNRKNRAGKGSKLKSKQKRAEKRALARSTQI